MAHFGKGGKSDEGAAQLGATVIFRSLDSWIINSSHLSKIDQISAGFLAIMWLSNGDLARLIFNWGGTGMYGFAEGRGEEERSGQPRSRHRLAGSGAARSCCCTQVI